jgi:hypothetical protein
MVDAREQVWRRPPRRREQIVQGSKKGISSNQLHRTLGVTLKTAWFMSHRIREAMKVVGIVPMGGAGEVVEADETKIGKVDGAPKHLGPGQHGALAQHRHDPGDPLWQRQELPC